MVVKTGWDWSQLALWWFTHLLDLGELQPVNFSGWMNRNQHEKGRWVQGHSLTSYHHHLHVFCLSHQLPHACPPPTGQSEVDVIYDRLADLPTVNDNGDPLNPGRFHPRFRQLLVTALTNTSPALNDCSPLAVMHLTLGVPPHTPSSSFTQEIELLWESLNLHFATLESAIAGILHPPLPSVPMPAPPTTLPVSKPCAQKPHVQSPTPAPAWIKPGLALAPTPVSRPKPPPPSFTSVAKTPTRPSLVMSLHPSVAGGPKPLAVHCSPQDVVSHLNTLLTSEGHQVTKQVTLSAAWWTAKNNLVVTTGPDTTVHHLMSASHFISDTLMVYLSANNSPLPVQTRENCKWPASSSTEFPWELPPHTGPTPLLNSTPLSLRITLLIKGYTSHSPHLGHSGELKHWKTKPHSTGKGAPAPSLPT
ncbi:hypothetical protein EDB86DRAFT_2828875 [Lactarius hatsudake]|nr:hypothetical protein EDB86DRAFT_2828875 [Lactarius hatsudake]